MALYRIVLYDRDGIAIEERNAEFSEGDEAIADIAAIDRPHETRLWQDDRLVLRCAPWTASIPAGEEVLVGNIADEIADAVCTTEINKAASEREVEFTPPLSGR